MNKTVIELFAGVGGFRVGLNHCEFKDGKTIEKPNFNFVWANQWEPSTKVQDAFSCYKTHFPGTDEELSNVDISLVNKKDLPEHTLLVGGFPCQDYSVARKTHSTIGIEGKKGVLWWQINDILKAKKPPFCLFENVNRLVQSPSKQRGRDFGIMLRCLYDQGYGVEWRIINAADYGFAQRRRRIYIFAYKRNTKYYKSLNKIDANELLSSKTIFAKAFPIEQITSKIEPISIKNDYPDLVSVSDNFEARFCNAGIMVGDKIYTRDVTPVFIQPTPLSKIVETNTSKDFYLDKDEVKKFEYLRGSKKIDRVASNGLHYSYTEGSMSPYDDLSLPGRTMLTSESSVNRSTHIIKDPKTNKLRFLTPVECERLNGFPDNWTNTGMSKKRRYFMMGNALVCGIIQKLGDKISLIIDEENKGD